MAVASSAPDQRMVLHHISWDTYEGILRDHADSSVPRFSYDQGTLEIMSPFSVHERYIRLLEIFVLGIAGELGVDVYSLGSTTFKREDLQRGLEPDACFYGQNQAAIRGKDKLDLNVDPPPDLAVEIDITHSSIDKLGIYGALGVPEVWRYDGERVEMLVHAGDHYVAGARSQAFPAVSAAALTTLLNEGAGLGDVAWLRRVQAGRERSSDPAP